MAESKIRPASNGADHQQLFDGVIELIKSYLVKYRDRTSKVVDFKTTSELKELIDFTVGDKGVDAQEILSLCEKVLTFSVHTDHPYFYNVLFCTTDEVGLLGAFLSATTNTNVLTYEIAPVFTLMEAQVLSQIRQIIGWTDGDGIFAPGGSIANLYGLLIARFQRFPESRTKGTHNLPQMAFFCSEQSHNSVVKSAILIGIGTENVVEVKCEPNGRMSTSDLDRKLSTLSNSGAVPVAVVATAGTTVLGAIDPLEEIAEVCVRHKVWLHVDAAVGGSLLFSRKHRHRLAGIDRADSVSWNPHKSMGIPLQCSVFNTRHQRLLADCNSAKAGYLFQQDNKISYDTSVDPGDISIQCGRVSDVFKLWLVWKHEGTQGFDKRIDWYMELTQYFKEQVKSRPNFHLMQEPDSTNVCFWYTPPCLQDIHIEDGQVLDGADRLTKVAPMIKARMIAKGNMMLAYQPLPGGVPNCLRMVNINPKSTKADMDYVLNEIEALGRDIVV